MLAKKLLTQNIRKKFNFKTEDKITELTSQEIHLGLLVLECISV
jgi:hypothetical protein